ncbi:pyridoxamine 5'-phosphate oxidase family protein [Nocardia sp. XZ_19_369]|uniref:pyridoxamine 5'-phosphate oxidase family protein n=1 Tax=Nocardia sp. XZ_19_369 TaxID=2769487 RepID=UPI00188FFE29|nr:pyridoxamine 5'-phosphate oxidase family protein [Nocardia sp. XZ_19_369]
MVKENVRKLHEVLRTLHTVMLTTIDDRYQLVSRPMALRADDFDGVLHLFAPMRSRAIANITTRAAVNISHTSPTTSISIAGHAHLIDDVYEIALRWHRGLDPWFQKGRVGAVLIEVTVLEGRCWTLS